MPRSLSAIAYEIVCNWKHPHFGAMPYLKAMLDMDAIDDDYGAYSGHSIVLCFLSNAAYWRGPAARRIKAELKTMLKDQLK